MKRSPASIHKRRGGDDLDFVEPFFLISCGDINSMFSLFGPSQPIRTREKVWLELGVGFLLSEFGRSLLDPERMIDDIPDMNDRMYSGTPDEVQQVFRTVCERMEAPQERISLAGLDGQDADEALGTYERGDESDTIRLSETAQEDYLTCVATLAHEIGHVRLLSEDRLFVDDPNHEQLTDLFAAMAGFGVYIANSTLTDDSGYAQGWSWWNIQKSGYLSSREVGYGLAVAVHFYGGFRPAWADHLRLDAQVPFDGGLKYLSRYHDQIGSLYGESYIQPADWTTSRIMEHGRAKTAGPRYAAVWAIKEGSHDPTQFESLLERLVLSDRDSDVRANACEAVAQIDLDISVQCEILSRALRDPDIEVRATAAKSFGDLQSPPAEYVRELEMLLRDEKPVRYAAGYGLKAFGESARSSLPQLTKLLTRALINCDDNETDFMLKAIAAIVPDGDEYFRQAFAHEGEFLKRIMSFLNPTAEEAEFTFDA
ncbi:HEAT repeat domain-containing protein [Stratiformator vulcanicus]|uniref:HEAT repeat protein n=1 Tax=Stratiformator vulcanicus TaxID=2527980 RepID=A0A517R5T7_9PLAN|nr:HEAT repeat domain-containing protein [Stratiformator vulcanicus]QDT39193.1 HEAT repeat protein [Stratiformator vulcanicus]